MRPARYADPVGGVNYGRTEASSSTAATSAWLHLLKKTLIRYPLDHADFEMARELAAVPASQRQEIERWIESQQAWRNP